MDAPPAADRGTVPSTEATPVAPAPAEAGPRITLVVSGLVVGGAERILTALANGWAEDGRAVAIVTLDRDDTPPFFPVHPAVRLVRTGLAGDSANAVQAVRNNLGRLTGLRHAIRETRPDIVISFMDRTNVLVLLATVGLRVPVIVSDRSSAGPGSWVWEALRAVTYVRAARVVLQTARAVAVAPTHLRGRTIAIPNPVLPMTAPSPEEGSGVERADGLAVAMGRLVPEKGFDLLIEAWVGVAAEVPAARLEIWGNGPERETLRRMIEELGLGGSVRLGGETRDPATVLRRASLFVLSSRVEGFPNVVLEAMSVGTPVVAFDAPFGPSEIVRHGVDGFLVRPTDTAGLGRAIGRVLGAPDSAVELGRRAREVGERFSFDAVMAMWDAAIEASRRGRRRR